MKQHTEALRGKNAYGGLSCLAPDSCSALHRNAGLWRERGTLPMAGHSQNPAQGCNTASASKGTAAFPPAGHMPTTAILGPAAWHPKLGQALRWSQSMELQPQLPTYPTAPVRAIGSPRLLVTAGRGGKDRSRAESGRGSPEPDTGGRSAVLEGTTLANTLSTNPEVPIGSHGHQKHSQVMLLWEQLDLSSPKDGDSTEVITQPYSMSKNQATS